MKKIGILDIDTSHPAAWIPIERELGYEVVGFYDSGAVHTSEYADQFAKEHNLQRFQDAEALADAVDIVIIHSCDWDQHIAKAELFIRAGKAVFIDKPMAGSLSDLHKLVEWEAKGARITGGSSMLYAREIAAYHQQTANEESLRAHTVFSGCGVDDFNYGIHAYSAAFAVLGFNWEKVRTADEGKQQVTHIVWKNGRQAIITVGKHAWLPTHLTLISDKKVEQIQLAIDDIYRPILVASLPWLAGETETPPHPMADLIQPEVVALASLRSRAQQGRWVSIDEMSKANERYDGRSFNQEYRAATQARLAQTS